AMVGETNIIFGVWDCFHASDPEPKNPFSSPESGATSQMVFALRPYISGIAVRRKTAYLGLSMSKAELVSVIQKSLGKDVSAAQAERVLAAVINGIKGGVKKTKSVQLIGFGTFKVASRKAR